MTHDDSDDEHESAAQQPASASSARVTGRSSTQQRRSKRRRLEEAKEAPGEDGEREATSSKPAPAATAAPPFLSTAAFSSAAAVSHSSLPLSPAQRCDATGISLTFAFLDRNADLAAASRVCRRWHAAAHLPTAWPPRQTAAEFEQQLLSPDLQLPRPLQSGLREASFRVPASQAAEYELLRRVVQSGMWSHMQRLLVTGSTTAVEEEQQPESDASQQEKRRKSKSRKQKSDGSGSESARAESARSAELECMRLVARLPHVFDLALALRYVDDEAIADAFQRMSSQLLELYVMASAVCLPHLPRLTQLRRLAIDFRHDSNPARSDAANGALRFVGDEEEPPLFLRALLPLRNLIELRLWMDTSIRFAHLLVLRRMTVEGKLRILHLANETTNSALWAFTLQLTPELLQAMSGRSSLPQWLAEFAGLAPAVLSELLLTPWPLDWFSYRCALTLPSLTRVSCPLQLDWLLLTRRDSAWAPPLLERQPLQQATWVAARAEEEQRHGTRPSLAVEDAQLSEAYQRVAEWHEANMREELQSALARFESFSAPFARTKSALEALRQLSGHNLRVLELTFQKAHSFHFLYHPDGPPPPLAIDTVDLPIERSGATLSNVQQLRLAGCTLTPQGWQHVASLQRLQLLQVSIAQDLTAAHAQQLAALPDFRHLTLLLQPQARVQMRAPLLRSISRSRTWQLLELYRGVPEWQCGCRWPKADRPQAALVASLDYARLKHLRVLHGDFDLNRGITGSMIPSFAYQLRPKQPPIAPAASRDSMQTDAVASAAVPTPLRYEWQEVKVSR